MKLGDALDILNNLIEKTNSKSELKIYQGFIKILLNLKNRELTDQQVKSIEFKLDSLDLLEKAENGKKHYRKKFNELTTYLNKEFSFIMSGHYTSLGMVYGMMFGSGMGMVFGMMFGGSIGTVYGLSIGTSVGMVLGMIFGSIKDAEAKKQNRVLI